MKNEFIRDSPSNGKQIPLIRIKNNLPEILFISSYPPRECGIATYSQDLIGALNKKFGHSFSIRACALESGIEKQQYPAEVKFIIDTSHSFNSAAFAAIVNENNNIKMVVVQHEFGLFHQCEKDFMELLGLFQKPVILVFHTVLPAPSVLLKQNVQRMIALVDSVVVMTHHSELILMNDYDINQSKINVIAHGTHLVPHLDKRMLKERYGLFDRKILSTFGLLSAGKGIETTLEALPSVIRSTPGVLFLIIGKTHPAIIRQEGEKYRRQLEARILELGIQDHVQFINEYLPLPDLLEYLQLTDIYLFTSKDPNQAVSGTFSYAMSSGCPIISTPIPHAREVLRDGAGMFIDFDNPQQLGAAIIQLLSDESLRKNISMNGLHRIASTAWENAAIAHARLFEKMAGDSISLQYSLPAINLDHLKRMTTDFGMIQFSKINEPDPDSGYTLDDNARALIAMCMHYELTGEEADVKYIRTYLEFIKHCLQPEGYFLNYVNGQHFFTEENYTTNLADANGRAVWALGYLISRSDLFPVEIVAEAELIMRTALLYVNKIHSTRAMAFVIKGLYYQHTQNKSDQNFSLVEHLANRLLQMYRHEGDNEWSWFESYLTYANSILPEAMLCAWLVTGNPVYIETAKASFDFLLSRTFNSQGIKVISNKSWLQKGQEAANHGEQPIDVAYTILAISSFYNVFKEEAYLHKMDTAFNWFLGKNHLHQIIYNPCTGGCYDGLEDTHVNLNQGAESTLSYLMARLTMEQYLANRQYKGRLFTGKHHENA